MGGTHREHTILLPRKRVFFILIIKKKSCYQEFVFRRLLAAFRVLYSSVLKPWNYEFTFRHHLAAFQPWVRVLPSSSTMSRFCNHKVVSSFSNHDFTSLSSISGWVFCSSVIYFNLKHSIALNKIIRYKIWFVRHKSATGSTDSIQQIRKIIGNHANATVAKSVITKDCSFYNRYLSWLVIRIISNAALLTDQNNDCVRD